MMKMVKKLEKQILQLSIKEEQNMLILYGISEGKQTKIGEFETFEECDKAIEEFKTIENELFKNNEITYVVKEEE